VFFIEKYKQYISKYKI